MLKYITLEKYKELTSIPSNSITEQEFNSLVIEVSQDINKISHGRIDENNIPDEVVYATAKIIDIKYDEETKISEIGTLKSQNIEGWSESYSTPEEITKEADTKIQKILDTYLWSVIGIDGLPLLYSGVCYE